jgi:RimJ/RimL family protein N-acetyltransferase
MALDGGLVFRPLPEVGEDAFFAAFAATHEGTRDAWLRRQIEKHGLDSAARAEFEDYKEFDHLPEWWELAYTADDELAGVIMPARNPTSAVIGHVGVMPQQRGRGFAAQLVRRGTGVLLASGAEEVRADCDSDNVAMVKAFERAGYAQIARRRTYQVDV